MQSSDVKTEPVGYGQQDGYGQGHGTYQSSHQPTQDYYHHQQQHSGHHTHGSASHASASMDLSSEKTPMPSSDLERNGNGHHSHAHGSQGSGGGSSGGGSASFDDGQGVQRNGGLMSPFVHPPAQNQNQPPPQGVNGHPQQQQQQPQPPSHMQNGSPVTWTPQSQDGRGFAPYVGAPGGGGDSAAPSGQNSPMHGMQHSDSQNGHAPLPPLHSGPLPPPGSSHYAPPPPPQHPQHPHTSLPMTYTPFQFRSAPQPEANGTAPGPPPSSLPPVSHGPPGDPSLAAYPPPPPHYQPPPPPGYMGPPPSAQYSMHPYPIAHDPHQPQHGHYGYSPYPAAAGYHVPYHPGSRYASPDINGNMTISGGPPGVVFARAADPRIARPKVKLTYDDKRRIVEIARSNSSLRQEDIAQQYGVDRSTISKILISAHRWTGPPQPAVVPIPKPPKQSGGGRFPVIEQRMHEWMDAQFAAGYEIRDNIARDKAKEIAREMGFTEERFKASAKWLDKFKERRRANGLRASVTATYESTRPNLPADAEGAPRPSHEPGNSSMQGGYYPYSQNGNMPHPYGQGGVSRPPSDESGSDTSGDLPPDNNGYPVGNGLHIPQLVGQMNGSNSMHTSMSGSQEDLQGNRQRSRSSPQRPLINLNLEPGSQDPASGKVSRPPSTGGLVRHNSLHGVSSPSPRRPVSSLSRSNSSASSVSGKRSHRPTSLAASAFGFTQVSNNHPHDDNHNHSPYPSHERGSALQPFTSSLSGMSISSSSHGTLSTSSSSTSINQVVGGPPPLTPMSPHTYQGNGHGRQDMSNSGHYYPPPHSGLGQPSIVMNNGPPQYATYSGYGGSSSGYGSQPHSANSDKPTPVGWRTEE